MNDINHVILTGNITKDVVAATLPNSSTVCANFCIACNHSEKKEDGSYVSVADFFYSKIYGNYAEKMAPFLKKGTTVTLEGTLRCVSWEKDGVTNTRVVIVTNNIRCAGTSSSGNNNKNISEETSSENFNFSPDLY